MEWKTVLPACSGKCSNAPNLGWTTKGVTKKAHKPRMKRKNAPGIDLCTFRPRPIEGCFDDWLADSQQAWDQLRFILETRQQIKKRRKRLYSRDDALSYLSFPSSKYTAVFITVNHLQYF